MGSKNSIFSVIFMDEMKRKTIKKDIVGAAALFLMAAVINPDIKSFGILLKGNIAVTLYLSILSMLSKIKDNRLKLWFSLPVDKNVFLVMYSTAVFIKNNLFKVIPFISAILLISLLKNKLDFLSFIWLLVLFIIEGFGAAILGIYIVFLLYEKDIIKQSDKTSKARFSWLKREFIRFYYDKSVMINHIGYSVFILFFIINFIFSAKGELQMLLFILGFISTCSTPGVLISLEKPNVNLIKSLPVSPQKLFIAKYIFCIIITLPVYIGAYIIFNLFKINMDHTILLILMILSLIFTTFIKLLYDFKKPYFNWGHTRQIFQNKRKYKLWGMSIMVAGLWTLYPYINPLLIALSQLILTLGFSIIIDKFSVSW